MKKNKMLSLAAAMILTSTAAMAFDANSTGVIVTHDNIIKDGFIQANYNPNYWSTGTQVKSGYVNANQSDANLTLSDSQYGDALIYSAFRTGDGWESEISVTNTSSEHAVVAKVVLYAADDSRELIDFNIYLSANDVFKFKVDANGVTTADDSIEASATVAYDVTADSDDDKVTMNTYGNVRQIASALPVQEGYAVIYAMAEANDDADANTTLIVADGQTDATYHKEHDDLFLDYRELLDTCRPGADDNNDTWRNALKSNDHMMNGMIRDVIQAPSVLASCDDNNTNHQYHNYANFGNPENNILFGTVAITNTANGSATDARNIVLPAVALSNFTDMNGTEDTMMLWTAGEMATISDRRMISDDNASDSAADYNASGLAADALTFEVATATYSYSDGEMANTLHVTSPVKRPLVQLLDNDSYWENVSSTKPYGEYDFSSTIYNDQEDKYEVATTVNSGIVVSPYNPDAAVQSDKILIESGGYSNLQAKAVEADAEKYKSGYVDINFNSNLGAKYPAIVTQMTAKSVNGNPITNWYFAPVK